MEDNRERIKYKIDKMREELNRIVLGGTEKNRVIEFSQELDLLINQYYRLSES